MRNKRECIYVSIHSKAVESKINKSVDPDSLVSQYSLFLESWKNLYGKKKDKIATVQQ